MNQASGNWNHKFTSVRLDNNIECVFTPPPRSSGYNQYVTELPYRKAGALLVAVYKNYSQIPYLTGKRENSLFPNFVFFPFQNMNPLSKQ